MRQRTVHQPTAGDLNNQLKSMMEKASSQASNYPTDALLAEAAVRHGSVVLEASASELKLPQIKPSALSQTLEGSPGTHRASIDTGKQGGVRNSKHQTEPARPAMHKSGPNSAYMDLIQAMV